MSAIAKAGSSSPSKGFGELFAEKKDALDHFQAKLAGLLPSMPGQHVAKYFDVAIGIDGHSTIVPPSPLMAVPHIGIVFDIMGAIMDCISQVLPPPPPEPEVPEGKEPPPKPITLASVCTAVVSAMKPTVQVHGQWIANAGTGIQHMPLIMEHGPVPVVAPMASSEMFMGSSTVLADGGPCSTQFHPALSCNLVGIPAKLRPNKPPKPKVALMAPTSMLSIITSGGNTVLVGGPPTIDLFQLMVKMGLKGLGKIWSKAGKKFQGLIDKIKAKNPKLASILQFFKCRLFGEPVDAATGRVYHTNTDFSLPGPIPLVWSRTYYSDAEVSGPLGYNWHHSYNMGLYDMGNGFYTVRLADGRETVLPVLQQGETFFSRREQLTWSIDAAGYKLADAAGMYYRFGAVRNGEGYRMLSTIQNDAGDEIAFHYNMQGALRGITDSAGRQLTVDSDALGRVQGIYADNDGTSVALVRYSYDAAGNMISTEDALGAAKHLEYSGHLLVKLTNQSGMSFYWEYEGQGDDARCIHTWGDGGILEYTTQYLPGQTITRNGLGHVTEYFYNEKKLIYKIVDANGGITMQHYNEHDELELVVNPEGLAVRTYYNDKGDIVRQENENNNATTYAYDAERRLTAAESPGGRSIAWQYDERGRMAERSGSGNPPLRYEYEGRRLHRITAADGRSYTLYYNNRAELVRLELPGGAMEQWTYDGLGNVLTAKDIKGNVIRYSYDAAGNVVRMMLPDGNEHRFTYDAAGNMTEAKDELHDVQFAYGPLGTLTARIQQGTTVRFNYDSELQLRSIFNEGGEQYRFGLDGLGQVVSEWGFDGLQRRYLRDGAGRVARVLRPAERWTAYQYDGTGNVVKEDHYDGTGAAYRYDKDGLLLQALNEYGKIQLKRDAAGRVVGDVQGGYSVSKKYDERGNLMATESSLGAAIQNTHDAAGYLQSMAAGGWQSTWQRDDAGLEMQRQMSGGIQVDTQRDRLGRVTRRSIGAGSIEQSRTRYEWGSSNRLHRLVNELTSATANFEYDAFDNLVAAQYNYEGETETIYRVPDKIGNLFKAGDRTDRKYGKGGRLEQDAKYNYYYDAEGNLVFKEFRKNEGIIGTGRKENEKLLGIKLAGSGTGWRYEWAGNGMLQKVANPHGSEVLFSYDPLGRRIAKQYKGVVTRWLWDGNVPLHEWRYEGGYPPANFVDEGGELREEAEPVENLITWVYEEGTFVPCARITADEQYSIVADYLGTPTHAFSSTGEQVWERELDVYGAVRSIKGDKNLIPQLYQGQWIDEETGLAYNRFRYYDNESGNYISQDPISLEGGNRLYGYVNNTNEWVDCMGLMPWEPGTPKPANWRLPKNGTWSGAPGHSSFTPNDPTSIGLKPGTSVPFVKGTPDFSGIQVREPINVAGLTGNQRLDKGLTAQALADKFPDEFKNKTAALNWMKDNKVTPHHFQGDTMQLVPTKPHDGIRHSGTAHEKRAKGGHH